MFTAAYIRLVIAPRKPTKARGQGRLVYQCASRSEIIFTRGTTEASILLRRAIADQAVIGDRIVITHLEHHSNIVPWQILCEQTGAELVVASIDSSGQIDLDEVKDLLDATYACSPLRMCLTRSAPSCR